MELADAVRRRKMVRSFTGDPLPGDVLEGILAAACSAPSAGNTGGWDAVVLVGSGQTAAFWDATTTEDWRRRSRRWPALSQAAAVVALFVDPEAYPARYRQPDKRSDGGVAGGGGAGGGGAGVVGGAVGDLAGGGAAGGVAGGAAGGDLAGGDLGAGTATWPVPYWFVDGGFAALLMLLSATDAGVGACFLGNFRGEPALRLALGVPDDRRYVGAVVLGMAAEDDHPSASLARGRRQPREVLHRGRW